MSRRRRLRGSTSASPTPSDVPSSAHASCAAIMPSIALLAAASAPGSGVAGVPAGGAATGFAADAACGRRCAAAAGARGGAGAGEPRGDNDGGDAEEEEEEEDGEDGASCSAGMPSVQSSSASSASPAAGIVRMRANMAATGALGGDGSWTMTQAPARSHAVGHWIASGTANTVNQHAGQLPSQRRIGAHNASANALCCRVESRPRGGKDARFFAMLRSVLQPPSWSNHQAFKCMIDRNAFCPLRAARSLEHTLCLAESRKLICI